jgi:hypothetical protein
MFLKTYSFRHPVGAVLAGRGAAVLTVLLSVFSIAPTWAQSVSLAWDPSASANVAGYNVYYGYAGGACTNEICVGAAVGATFSGLNPGTTYYFAVTAYAFSGMESAPSSQVSYTVPPPPPAVLMPVTPAGWFVSSVTGPAGQTLPTHSQGSSTLPPPSPEMQISVTPAGQFVLSVTGPAGQTYDIQATQDFKTWTVIGAVTVGTGGSANFTDTNAAVFLRRFYRARSEGIYTLPPPPPEVQMSVTPAGQFVLSVTGPVGQTYDIQATQDLKTWTVIGAVTVGTGGSVNFTDTNAAGLLWRFYRAHGSP